MSDAGSRTPERKVLGELRNLKAEPISPTANLRLLTSLASNLKNATDQNEIRKPDSPPVASGSTALKLLPRKQKSLGLLCNKFLHLYPLDIDSGVVQEISLDGTAKVLGTEKRRIYDIINVLESLEMASKAGKNRYVWHGQSGLITTLARLKSTAIRLGLREQIREIQKISNAYSRDLDNSPVTTNESMSFEDTVDDETFSDTAIKEDKSLGAMCQKFIMLFLVSMKHGVINLDIAAKVLIIDMDNQPAEILDNSSRSRFKTKVRRLYDIANVLTAIGLIKKVYMYDRAMKKPVFKYIGPNIESSELDNDTPVRGMQNTPIGMSTPNRRAYTAPRAIRINTLADAGYKTFSSGSSRTPITDKRKLRKRKLFDTDSFFARTHSTPNLEGKSRSLERLDDSILRVAEMELERLNSSEECKPKACTKLITRYNSDSCIINTNVNNEQTLHMDSEFIPLITVSNENLVVRQLNYPTYSCNNISTPKTGIQLNNVNTINSNHDNTMNKIESKIPLLPKPLNQRIIKLLPIAGISSQKATYPNTYIHDNITKSGKIARYKIEPKLKPPKVINLANFDPKKLIPIKRSDLRISFATTKKIETINTTNKTSGYAMLTRIQAPVVLPGDTFKAIKVGNTLQLVPLKNTNIENNSIDHENQSTEISM